MSHEEIWALDLPPMPPPPHPPRDAIPVEHPPFARWLTVLETRSEIEREMFRTRVECAEAAMGRALSGAERARFRELAFLERPSEGQRAELAALEGLMSTFRGRTEERGRERAAAEAARARLAPLVAQLMERLAAL